MEHMLRLSRSSGAIGLVLATALVVAACQGGAAGSPATSTPTAAPGASGQTPSAVSPSSGGVAVPSPIDSGPPLAVIGTENFYADLLVQIGGPRVSATSFLNDSNADPHEFESSPQDAALVADASLVIVNGLGYDDFMQKLLGASTKPDRLVVDVQELLGLPPPFDSDHGVVGAVSDRNRR